MLQIFSILMIFLLSSTSFAKKSEEQLYLEAIKEEQTEDQIKGQAEFKECQEIAKAKDTDSKKQKEQTLKCYEDKIKDLDESAIKKLSEKMNLKSYDQDAAKSTKSIKDYLQKRLNDAVFGKKIDPKKIQVTDHRQYFEVYRSQVGKNVLLDISKYCLENYGKVENKYQLNIAGNLYTVIKFDPNAAETGVPLWDKEGMYTYNDSMEPAKDGQSVSAREFKVCRKSDPKDCLAYERHPELIALLKRKMFEVGEKDPKTILGGHYRNCAVRVGQMCEVYRCDNSYNKNTPDSVLNECVKILGFKNEQAKKDWKKKIKTKSSEGISLESTSRSNGLIACNLEGKLKDYRRTLLALDADDAQYKKMRETYKKSEGSFNIDKGSNLEFKELDEDGINKVTSISSTEMTTKVDEIKKSEEFAEELKEECFEEDGTFFSDKKECASLRSGLNEKSVEGIEQEASVETAIYLKKIELLRDKGDQKKLDEFLKEHGLENYVKNLGNLSEEELTQVIKDKYKAERMAQSQAVNDRFKNERRKKAEEDKEGLSTKAAEKDIAKQSLADIKHHKKRVETLFQYSNIITSYLTIQEKSGGETKDVGSNEVSRNVELEGLKGAKDSKVTDADILEKYSENSDSSSTGSKAGGGIVDVGFLDQVLGNTEDKEAEEDKK